MNININSKGQAAILIIFVIGMVGLLIGLTLSKTGFTESMMGRGTAGSTKAFYIANAGIEDAFYKIIQADSKGEDFEDVDGYNLDVGEGEAKITVVNQINGDEKEKIITSSGKYKNFLRNIQVKAYNTKINPEFTKIIQVGYGGIEIENNVKISAKKDGQEYAGGNIYSNSFIRGKSNSSKDGKCQEPSSFINGNAVAVDIIDKLGNSGDGPCISGNAFSGNLNYCEVLGDYAYSYSGYNSNCPISEEKRCDPSLDPLNCIVPEPINLPDIKPEKIKKYIENYGETYNGDCKIGGTNDCSSNKGGKKYLGFKVINGNLTINSDIYFSGPVWVKGNLIINSNKTIFLAEEVKDITSLIILVSGKIETESNVTFESGGKSYLLLASEYKDISNPLCNDSDGNAITINANVKSILFYAIKGCAIVKPTAGKEFFGAIIAEAALLKQNVNLYYDPNLQNSIILLSQEEPWKISSFTEL